MWISFFILVFIIILPAWATIQKAMISSIQYEGAGAYPSITIEGSITTDGSGTAYLEAYFTVDGKDYKTQFNELQAKITEQTYHYSFRKDDFRFIDHQKNQVEALPAIQPGQEIVVYIYQEKITSGENLTIDAQNEINQRGYVLRGILAKKTFTIPGGNK